MPAVVGCDLSTRALDLVKLDENTNHAEWVRCELAGRDAWERTLSVRDALTASTARLMYGSWWDDVYLVAIEAPYGRGQAGTNALLNRVVGAVAASLPAKLRTPERCWIVAPHEWKGGLGLTGKPSYTDLVILADDGRAFFGSHSFQNFDQNACDAYCLALWARDENARAVAKALEATA